jgi:hypothetical protein
MIWFFLYIGSIVLANWLITVVGLVAIGPLLVPAGSFAAGLTFGLRDLLQRDKGRRWAIIAILVGAAVSVLLSPQLALASGAAFLLSELLDQVIYTRLLARDWTLAVVASNIAGSIVDTILFLFLAGFLAGPVLAGTVLVKWLAILPILAIARYRARRVAALST